jgi:hypothetical protein
LDGINSKSFIIECEVTVLETTHSKAQKEKVRKMNEIKSNSGF